MKIRMFRRNNALNLLLLGITFLSLRATMPQAVAADAPIPISNGPQLFLDDVLVARMKNLKRDVKQPVKHAANPLIKQDYPWEKRTMQVYGTVLYEPETKKFRCWYMSSENDNGFPATPEAPGLPEYYICYAESEDGIHWSKPMVGQGKLGPHTTHNIVIPGGHGICVMKTPEDRDPKRLYKAAGGPTYAFSSDGIQWKMHNWRPAIGKNDTTTSVVKWKDEFLAYVRNQEKEPAWSGVMRGVGLSTSKDFIHWSPKKSVFVTDEKDGYPWVQPHALCVTAYGDQLIGLLPLIAVHPTADVADITEVQLMVSRDGRAWQRVADRAPFMAREKPEPMAKRSWDYRFHPGSTMLVKDDLVYIYYYGTSMRWGEESWRGNPPASGEAASKAELVDTRSRIYGIGLATLPADRFVSLRPENWAANGVLETHPLQFSGRNLLVNANLSVGKMQVEVLDKDGKVLPGFAAEQSELTVNDPLRYRVTWKADGAERTLGDVPAENGRALRFLVRDGDFYAFQVKD